MQKFSATDLDILWGAKAIGEALDIPETKANHLLAKGALPAKKIGGRWVTTRQALRAMFADLQSTEAA